MMRGAFTSVLRRKDAIEIAIVFPFLKTPKLGAKMFLQHEARGAQ
jgi:hypothetical protein